MPEKNLFRRFWRRSSVRDGVIPNGFARQLPPLGCLERMIFQKIDLADVSGSR